jgi:hypothetical protein
MIGIPEHWQGMCGLAFGVDRPAHWVPAPMGNETASFAIEPDCLIRNLERLGDPPLVGLGRAFGSGFHLHRGLLRRGGLETFVSLV